METETNTKAAVGVLFNPATGCYAITKNGHRLALTPDELATVVQAAYDTHGIVAMPSYAAEADRAPGACGCGQRGCSDAMVVAR